MILSKADGDARGGAALSVKAVTGHPILYVGTGEKPDDLEDFIQQLNMIRKLGSMKKILGMLPGVGQMPGMLCQGKKGRLPGPVAPRVYCVIT